MLPMPLPYMHGAVMLPRPLTSRTSGPPHACGRFVRTPRTPPAYGLVCDQLPKSELTPAQEIEFLGFTVNSAKMELKLPGEKIKKIRPEVNEVFQSQQLPGMPASLLNAPLLPEKNS